MNYSRDLKAIKHVVKLDLLYCREDVDETNKYYNELSCNAEKLTKNEMLCVLSFNKCIKGVEVQKDLCEKMFSKFLTKKDLLTLKNT
jgi:hypothetical protein